jgi:hypothetical protein
MNHTILNASILCSISIEWEPEYYQRSSSSFFRAIIFETSVGYFLARFIDMWQVGLSAHS